MVIYGLEISFFGRTLIKVGCATYMRTTVIDIIELFWTRLCSTQNGTFHWEFRKLETEK